MVVLQIRADCTNEINTDIIFMFHKFDSQLHGTIQRIIIGKHGQSTSIQDKHCMICATIKLM